ncbi:hypothetical protein C7T94_05895 [Pedobacter yulinensis]|uniref:DUF6734 domain-containing protein n=1 Tax=Pedobacter yulinensis TaxID=2126353 RepID=A0A2T3HPD8_9SPHI|nr:DUF6734 family protein [Pedobacter yulinensis]PST84251.1 hypothetical protein C7T94_05895 [Pedobacter yulinensis]
MKIVQTFWTKPGLHGHWPDPVFHYMSWALSCLQLRQFYNQVELYTDHSGAELLHDRFRLPYTGFHLTLNNFPFADYLWSAPKLHTYSLQQESFLHVDGDVFLFRKIPESFIEKHDVVCQNLEIDRSGNKGFYAEILKTLFAVRPQHTFPGWLASARLNDLCAMNAGIMGGSNISFFQRYTRKAFTFLTGHDAVFSQLEDPQYMTHLAEQVLPGAMMRNENISLGTLLSPDLYPGLIMPDTNEAINEDHFAKQPLPFKYLKLDEHGLSPSGRKYAHVMGSRKWSLATCKQLARRLKKDYPDVYERVLRHASTKQYAVTGKKMPATFVEKIGQIPPEKAFRRSVRMAAVCGAAVPSSGSVDAFEQAMLSETNKLGSLARQKMEDVLRFEAERIRTARSWTAELLRQHDSDCLASQDLITDETALKAAGIWLEMNPQGKRVVTQWNWLNSRELGPPNPLRIRHQVVLLPESITHSLIEIGLSPVQLRLINILETAGAPCEASALCRAAADAGETPETAIFKALVFLVANGVLLASKFPNRPTPLSQSALLQPGKSIHATRYEPVE